MKILVACEFSGRVRDAFIRKGHNAVSCDLKPSLSKEGFHYTGDVKDILHEDWDMLIAFPPCTYLAASGLHWNKKSPEREMKTLEALEFIKTLMEANIEKIAIENPVGCISTRIRKPDQIIQPYNFGENASKRTCLWLKGLPKLRNTLYYPPKIINGKKRWANQTPSGQSNFPQRPDRAEEKSLTYLGIATAMAEQWS